MKTNSYAAQSRQDTLALSPFNAVTRAPRCAYSVLFCGFCHTDLSLSFAKRVAGTTYPLPFRATNYRTRRGNRSAVKHLRKATSPVVGCMVDSCPICDNCKDNLEQFCEKGADIHHKPEQQLGGIPLAGIPIASFVDQAFVLHIPKELIPRRPPRSFGAGITTYSPLRHNKSRQRQKVGSGSVCAMGGPFWAHGVKLAKHWRACGVFTHSKGKVADALRLGADVKWSTQRTKTR